MTDDSPGKNRLVSVIIPTYNCGSWISESVESVLQQTHQHLEILVVDDGSTDHTREVLDPYIQSDQLEYIYQRNEGPASARNTGIERASGTYVAFLDADDVWLPEKTEKQLSIMKQNHDVAVVTSNTLMMDGDGNVTGRTRNTYPDDFVKLAEEIFFSNIVRNTPTILARRQSVEEIGGFNEDLPQREDHFFLMQMADRYTLHHCPEFLVKIRNRSESLGSNLKEGKPDEAINRLLAAKQPFIEKALAEFPFLAKHKYQMLSSYHSDIAFRSYKKGDRRQALLLAKEAIILFPLRLRNYALFILFLLPFSYEFVSLTAGIFAED